MLKNLNYLNICLNINNKLFINNNIKNIKKINPTN